MLDEEPQVLVDSGQRNCRSSAPHLSVDCLSGVMSRRRYDGLVDDLTLVRSRQTTLPS